IPLCARRQSRPGRTRQSGYSLYYIHNLLQRFGSNQPGSEPLIRPRRAAVRSSLPVTACCGVRLSSSALSLIAPLRSRARMTRKGARPAAARRDRTEMSSADGDVNPRELEDRLGYHLQRAYRAHLRRFAAVGAAHRIRSSQFSILNVVHRNPSIRQADLAKALGKKDANIVTALDELQRRGLIARMRDPGDGRSRILR